MTGIFPAVRGAGRPAFSLSLALIVGALCLAQLAVATPRAEALETLGAHAADTPDMGWDSYYSGLGSIHCSRPQWTGPDCLNETNIEAVADAMKQDGLAAAGYRYIWIDTGWWNGHRVDGDIDLAQGSRANQWPDGMKAVVDYIHQDGLKAGIYTDAGREVCGDGVGSYQTPSPAYPNPYQQDVDQFAAWGFDAIKVDFCGGNLDGLDPAAAYGQFRDAMLSANPSMLLAICNFFKEGWNYTGYNTPADLQHSAQWSYAFGPQTGNSWRTETDIANEGPGGTPATFTWANVLRSLDSDALHPEAAGPGGWNDADALGPDPAQGLTPVEAQAQFTMWAMLASPLVIGSDVRPASEQPGSDHTFDYGPGVTPSVTLRTLTDSAVIQQVVQDPAGAQAAQVPSSSPGMQVWMRRLSGSGNRAVAFLDRSGSAAATGSASWSSLGYGAPPTVTVLSSPSSIEAGKVSVSSTAAGLNVAGVPAGGAVLVKLSGPERVDWNSLTGTYPSGDPPAGTPVGVWRELSGGTGEEDLFVRGSDGDVLWSRGTAAPVWTSLGGDVAGQPAVVSPTPGEIDLFARGLDDALWHLSIGGSGTPGGWERIGGTTADSPAAASPGPDEIDAFIRGADGALWQTTGTADGSAWRWSDLVRHAGPVYTSDADPENGRFVGSPAAASSAPGRIDVAVRGVGDGVYYLSYTPSGGWAPTWQDLTPTTSVSESPAAVSVASGSLDVFARGIDDGLWGTRQTGSGWASWTPLGGPVGAMTAGPASAAAFGSGLYLGGENFAGAVYGESHAELGELAAPIAPVCAKRPRHRRVPSCRRVRLGRPWLTRRGVAIRVACPATASGGCATASYLTNGGRAARLGARRARIAPGKQKVVAVLERGARPSGRIELTVDELLAGKRIVVGSFALGS